MFYASLKKGAATCAAAQPLVSQYGPMVEQGCSLIGGGSVNGTMSNTTSNVTSNTTSNVTSNTTSNTTQSVAPSPKQSAPSSGMNLKASLISVFLLGLLI